MSEITLTSEITTTPIQTLGGDHMVVAAARVSSNGAEAAKWADPEYVGETAGLIRSLERARHGTPFEHAYLTFFVHAPRFIWLEIARHRHNAIQIDDLSLNQESGRYKELEPVFWVPRRERLMVKPENYKAMRPTFVRLEEDGYYEYMLYQAEQVCRSAYDAYLWELSIGIAPEVARRHLPESIYNSGWLSGTPRAFLHFISLRTHEPDAAYVSYPQAEIEEVARVIETTMDEHWPKTMAAFNKYGRVAP